MKLEDVKPAIDEYFDKLDPEALVEYFNKVVKPRDRGKSPQEIWEEAFIAGSRYGYYYHVNTGFPAQLWETYCEGHSKQKAIKLNPYHSLNELED